MAPVSNPRGMSLVPRFVAAAATVSWLAPFLALLLVGVSEQGGAAAEAWHEPLVLVAEAAAVLGLALGAGAVLGMTSGSPSHPSRRSAVLGIGTSVVVLVLTQVAWITGTESARDAESELQSAMASAMNDFPGWNGVARIDGAEVFAVEVDSGSRAAKLLRSGDGRALRLVLFGVDAGPALGPLTISVDSTVAVGATGPVATSLPVEGAVRRLGTAATPGAAAAVTVNPGERVEGLMALFPDATPFQQVHALRLRVGGTVRTIPGRYFTVAEKRAIAAARRREAIERSEAPQR